MQFKPICFYLFMFSPALEPWTTDSALYVSMANRTEAAVICIEDKRTMRCAMVERLDFLERG